MTDTQRTPGHARRGFLRGAVQSAVAGVAALFLHPAPAVAVVAPARPVSEPIPLRPEPAHIHPAGGLHEKFRVPDSAEYLALSRRFTDSLNDEQRRMHFDLDRIAGARHTAESDAFVEELCRHMLLMAPAIRCVANHLWEQKLADQGTCCAHPWEEPDLA